MTEEVKYPKCKGKNCGCTDGRSHSAECVAEHEAACNPDGIYSAPAQPEDSPEQCGCGMIGGTHLIEPPELCYHAHKASPDPQAREWDGKHTDDWIHFAAKEIAERCEDEANGYPLRGLITELAAIISKHAAAQNAALTQEIERLRQERDEARHQRNNYDAAHKRQAAKSLELLQRAEAAESRLRARE